MGRRHLVYNFLLTVRRRSFHVRLGCPEAMWVFLLYRTHTRVPRLRKWFSALRLPQIPLDLYHMCLAEIEQVFTIIQMSLCLAFGRHFVVLFNPPFFPLSPSDRSHRSRSFRSRRRADSNS